MFSRNGLSLCAGLILLAVCAAPATAQSIMFKNDTTMNLVVHPGSITPQGMIKRDRPYQLAPKDTTPRIMLPGTRVVTIYDPKNPTRPIYQGNIPNDPKNDLQFSIQLDGNGKVKVVQVK